MNETIRLFLVGLIARHDRGRPTRTILTSREVPFQHHDQIMQDLKDLSESGLIKYTTTPMDRRQNLPGAVALIPDRADDLAVLVGAPRLAARMDDLTRKTDQYVTTEWIEDCRSHLRQLWARGLAAFALKEGAIKEAEGLFRILSAIAAERHYGKDQRQFSVEVFDDSKFFERHAKFVAAALRFAFDFQSGEADRIFEQIGMTIFPKPTFVSGRLTLAGGQVHAKPYIGLAAEMLPDVVPVAPRFVLSIENLASFHRFCRELSHNGLVVYSGGFPSRATLGFLRDLSRRSDRPDFFHWGDIDAGGVAIFRMIEQAIDGPLRPHAMTAEIGQYGVIAKADARLTKIAKSDSAIAGLAAWLASDEGRTVEQEMLPPSLPACEESTADAAMSK